MTIAPTPLAPVRTDTSGDALRAAIQDDLARAAIRRRVIPGERIIRTPTVLGYVCDVASPRVNEIVAARFAAGSAADAAIEAAIARFEGKPFLWWVGPSDEPADLSDRLTRRGVIFLDDIPGMAMDLADLDDEPAPDELRVAPVLDEAGIDAFHAVLSHGFPEDFVDHATTGAITASSRRQAIEAGFREPNGVPTRWVGWVGERPVTTTRLHTGAGVAGIYAVVTVDDARRRGYGAAVTRHVLHASVAAGIRIATLQASTAGKGVYERIGFRQLCRYRLHEWQAAPAR